MKLRTFFAFAALLSLAACNQNANHKTIGNTSDTLGKAGGPPIRDTATINKDRLDSTKPGKSSAKGNADPSGRIKNQ